MSFITADKGTDILNLIFREDLRLYRRYAKSKSKSKSLSKSKSQDEGFDPDFDSDFDFDFEYTAKAFSQNYRGVVALIDITVGIKIWSTAILNAVDSAHRPAKRQQKFGVFRLANSGMVWFTRHL